MERQEELQVFDFEDLTWALWVSGTAKFGSNCGQDIRLRFGHDVKLFDRDFEADF